METYLFAEIAHPVTIVQLVHLNLLYVMKVLLLCIISHHAIHALLVISALHQEMVLKYALLVHFNQKLRRLFAMNVLLDFIVLLLLYNKQQPAQLVNIIPLETKLLVYLVPQASIVPYLQPRYQSSVLPANTVLQILISVLTVKQAMLAQLLSSLIDIHALQDLYL